MYVCSITVVGVYVWVWYDTSCCIVCVYVHKSWSAVVVRWFHLCGNAGVLSWFGIPVRWVDTVFELKYCIFKSWWKSKTVNMALSLLSLIARSRRMNRESSTARQSFFIVCIHLRNFANATSSSSSHNFWLGKVHNIPVPSLLSSIISEYSHSTHTRTRREWNRHHTFYTQLYSMPNKRINQNHSLITILLLQELWPMNQK